MPLTFKVVSDFHAYHVKELSFPLFKAVIGAIDLYVLERFHDDREQRLKQHQKG